MSLLLLALALTGAAPSTGTLHVTGPDYGVEVAVDRRPVGHMPLDPLVLPVGLHVVEVLQGGRAVWSRVVFVGPGQTVDVAVALAPSKAPSPTLGELRRGDSTPRAPPPRYHLTGSVAAEGSAAGAAWDLDLIQRWRLEADPEGIFKAATEVLAVGDLAGEGAELWRTAHRASDAPLLVEALWLQARGDAIAGRLGRQPQSGPMHHGFLMDGGRVDGALGPIRLYGRGGLRRAIIGPQPDSPWLAGLGLQADGDGWGASADLLHHGGLHVDAAGRAELGPVRLSGGGGLLDSDVIHADGRMRIDLAAATAGWLNTAWLCGRWRGDRRSPFDLPARWATVIALDTPAGPTACAGLRARLGPVELRLDGGVFDGQGAPSIERPDRSWLTSTAEWARGGWGATLGLGSLDSDVGPAPEALGLSRRRFISIGGWLLRGRMRLSATAGYEQLALLGPAGAAHRGLPTGSLGAVVALTHSISLVAHLDASAAHPALHATSGMLLRGRIGLRLR